MAGLADFRQQHPEYNDMSDGQLALALHNKFYSDVPMVDYLSSLGLDRRAVMNDALKTGGVDSYKSLMDQLAKPGKNETPEQAAIRTGGKIEDKGRNPFTDVLRALFQGGAWGWGDEIQAGAQALSDQTPNMSFAEKYPQYLSRERGRLDQFRKENPVAAYGAEVAGAIPTSMLLGGELGAGGNLASRMGTGLLVGAGQGAIYGAGASDGDLKDRATGAMLGGVTGGVTGAAVPAVVQGVRRLISPAPASAEKLAAADILRNEGVDLTAGQRTGNKPLQYMEAGLGGNAARNFADRQADQFTSAALMRAGVAANRATPDVMAQAGNDIGQMFDTLAARNSIRPDARLAQDLQRVWHDYSGVVAAAHRAPIVQNTIRSILAEAQTGSITGAFYQSVRSRLGRLAAATKDTDLGGVLKDINATLDQAMGRTIRVSNPADLGIWQEARRRYANLLVLEDAVSRAGEKAADGIITPQALRSAALKQGRRAFIRGRSEFTDLANAGVSTMTPLPDSGTAGRIGAKMVLPAGAITGATIGNSVAPGIGAVVGGAAGLVAPPAIGRMMLSARGRALLGNQVAAGPGGGPLEALIRSAGLPASAAFSP